MASNYQKDMYRQLAELMLKHDSLTNDAKNIKSEHFEKIVEKRSVQMSHLVSVLNELCACDVCPIVTAPSFQKKSLTEEADLHETF